MRKQIIALLLLLSGCSAPTYQLDAKWSPLEQVVERNIPIVSDSATTTIGDTVYTTDLDAWLKRFPPNSPKFNALLSHERVHSLRQEDQGLLSWLFDYLTDDDFKLKEEQMGWEQEIRISRQLGVAKPDEMYAAILSQEYQGMVSYADALNWVRSIR